MTALKQHISQNGSTYMGHNTIKCPLEEDLRTTKAESNLENCLLQIVSPNSPQEFHQMYSKLAKDVSHHKPSGFIQASVVKFKNI